ncbi:hypothetical protein MM326_03400 [Alkalihalobacillus sp. LMS6]|uniref:hypothetical protein n=1 Tax=Alkalihalobacillus sp. LMS6 TaxID=2924034 RepID=UPI0020D01EBE|nr:hypothetical protein [Alkalihalobacillus sp. LMS6]UTR07092.1 hypothetical protein MM326_03400 [Alkalihalobacillus sp. LMS6]
MTRKKKWSIGLVAGIVALSATLYFMFNQPPDFDSFPADEELREALAQELIGVPEEDIVIQGNEYIADTNRLIPYYYENQYGFAIWEWSNDAWEQVVVTLDDGPGIWLTEENDPYSYQLIWNENPDIGLTELEIFTLEDRGYYTNSMDVYFYYPQIQMPHTISLDFDQQSYGMEPFPNEWAAFHKQVQDLDYKTENQAILQSGRTYGDELFYAWRFYDEHGEVEWEIGDHHHTSSVTPQFERMQHYEEGLVRE